MAKGLTASSGSQPPFALKKIPGIHFCHKLGRLQATQRLEGLGQQKKTNDLI
jgi:hypothetical protein